MHRPASLAVSGTVLLFCLAVVGPAYAAQQGSMPEYQVEIQRDVRIPMRDGVTLAAELDRHVVCSDISSDALQIARRNARRHSVENRVSFVVSDLLNAFNAPFDLILSNPPYIGLGERDSLAPDVREFEPEGALFSGPEGLDVIARLIDEAPRLLRPGGQMLLEIGAGQSRAVSELARLNGAWREAVFVSDLSGHDRVAVLTAVPQP